MTADPLACPYCNALASVPFGSRPGQRVPCWRCGESFVLRDVPEEAITTSPPVIPPGPAAPVVRTHRIPNWAVALAILCLMAGMAMLALAVMLGTVEVRRAHDAGLPKDRTLPIYLSVFVGIWLVGLAGAIVREVQVRLRPQSEGRRLPFGYVLAAVAVVAMGGVGATVLAIQVSRQRASRPEEPPPPVVEAVAPAKLEGLRYLPADVDLIAGVHAAEVLQDPAGRKLLKDYRLDGPDGGFAIVEQWTGLPREEIDHLALGMNIKDNPFVPHLVLVVRTVRPYDGEALRQKIKATPLPPDRGPKALYKVEAKEAPFSPNLWFADEQTIAIGLLPGDLKKLPDKPREDATHLPAPLRAALETRLGPGMPLWAVGKPEGWDKTFLWLKFVPDRNHPLARLLPLLQTFAAGVLIADVPTLAVHCECKNDAAAQTLETELKAVDWKKLGRGMDEAVTTREGTWVTVQLKARPPAPRPDQKP